MSSLDQTAASATLRSLSSAMFQALAQSEHGISADTRDGLCSLWSSLEGLALPWAAVGDALANSEEEIMLSGSTRLVEALPEQPKSTISPRQDRLATLLKTRGPDYLRLCLSRGLDPALPIMPVADLLGRHLADASEEVRAPYLALLFEELAGAAIAVDNNGRFAWDTISAYDKDPALKIRLLKHQIGAFPDQFTRAAENLSREPRRCGPLLLLVLAGTRIKKVQPLQGHGVPEQRMQVLCSKLTSHHGLMELHGYFGDPETLLPQLQSRLDTYLAARGAPSV